MSDDKIIDEVLSEDAAERRSPAIAAFIYADVNEDDDADPDFQYVVLSTDYDALRQQLADVSNERDELRNQCAGIYQQLEICQKQRDNRQDRLKDSEARNVEVVGACDLAAVAIELDPYGRGANFVRVLREIQRKAQSAPAPDEHGAGS